MIRLWLLAACLLLTLQLSVAQLPGFAAAPLTVFEGNPQQMQWSKTESGLIVSLQIGDTVRHICYKPGDSSAVWLDFGMMPRYVAPHPTAKAWAGALEGGEPWSAGTFRFLSRFGQRKIFLRQPMFNGSGNLLAFSAYTPYNKEWRLMTYDLKYDNLNSFNGLPAEVSYPVWSPKSSFIAFVLPADHPARRQVAVTPWDGSSLRYYRSDSLSFEYAAWPGNEQYLLLTAKGNPGWYLLHRHLHSSAVETLYFSISELRFAQWIPETRKLVFLQKKDGQWELWWLDLDAHE